MGFKIALGTRNIVTGWFTIDTTTVQTLYVGQLVMNSTGGMNGVGPLAAASGAYDVTGDQQILGVVIGTNNYPMTELNNATYGQYITAVAAQAGQKAIMKMGVEGMHAKGDPAPMVQVALIDNTTWLEGQFCNATYGVAPTLLTVTTGDTTGAGFTCNASEMTSVANLATCYFRTGANAGIYRVVKTAHATVHTFDTYFPYAIAVGDTAVMVPARQGTSYVQINSTTGYLGMCFNTAATAASNYFGIDVLSLDLKEAGKERCVFRFNAAHFAGIRT
jgi:hypothetical protein